MITRAAVDSGDWTYSGDPLATDRDEVRFLIDDSQLLDQWISDQEIGAALKFSEQSGRPGGSCSTSALLVNGAAALGATLINLRATTVTGTLDVGDTFLIAGDGTRYAVTAQNTAASNKFTGVAIAPGLAKAATDGTAVSLRWANIYEAAALCLEKIARRLAREPDITQDGRSRSFATQAELCTKQASDLRLQGGGHGSQGFVPLVRC